MEFILRGKSLNFQRETRLITNLSAINLPWNGLESKKGFHGEKPATLSHATSFLAFDPSNFLLSLLKLQHFTSRHYLDTLFTAVRYPNDRLSQPLTSVISVISVQFYHKLRHKLIWNYQFYLTRISRPLRDYPVLYYPVVNTMQVLFKNHHFKHEFRNTFYLLWQA